MIDKFLNILAYNETRKNWMKSHIGKKEMSLIFLNIGEYDI